jgi:uncharacterized membrane protein YeaQ/YmgE (transglycosylase-associated protein family)
LTRDRFDALLFAAIAGVIGGVVGSWVFRILEVSPP